MPAIIEIPRSRAPSRRLAVERSPLCVEVPPPQYRPMRLELILRVRAEIAAGTYDTPEKLDIALDRLVGTVGRVERRRDFPKPRGLRARRWGGRG